MSNPSPLSASSTLATSLEQQRSGGIDVLRGICVLLVTLHHIHLRFKFNGVAVNELLPAPVARVLFWSGYFAVITFFEIYLAHMLPVLVLVPAIVESKPAVTPWLLAWYVVLLIASVALGWVVHHVYSEPLNRALRSRRLSPIDPAAPIYGGAPLQVTRPTTTPTRVTPGPL